MIQLNDKEQKILHKIHAFYVYKQDQNYSTFKEWVLDHESFLSFNVQDVRELDLKIELERLKNFE